MTRIVKCKVENILGVKNVEFSPNGNSLTIGGKNGQGKSSALWALVMALGGKGQIPQQPVHNGAELGTVQIELDRFNVFFEVGSDRNAKVRVEAKDGARYSSPQTMLNDFFSNLSFDPGAFKSMESAKRTRVLLDLVGLDFTELDSKTKAAREDRTIIGREVTQLKAKLVGMVRHEDAPAELVDLGKLHEQFIAATKIQGQQQALETRIMEIDQQKKYKEEQIDELREEIRLLENERLKASVTLSGIQVPAIGAIQDEIAGARAINSKVDENKKYREVELQLTKREGEYNLLSQRIETAASDREKALSEAKFPIQGLGFVDGDVTYNGIPFSQLSESEQWEISTAIGFALNPHGIVFMRNSGGLDKDARARVRARAAELGVQLFLEVVDDADDVQLLIEDGTVKEDRTQPETTQLTA